MILIFNPPQQDSDLLIYFVVRVSCLLTASSDLYELAAVWRKFQIAVETQKCVFIINI
jgi:hypothetical protein